MSIETLLALEDCENRMVRIRNGLRTMTNDAHEITTGLRGIDA